MASMYERSPSVEICTRFAMSSRNVGNECVRAMPRRACQPGRPARAWCRRRWRRRSRCRRRCDASSFGGDVALLLPHECPQLVNLEPLAGEVAHLSCRAGRRSHCQRGRAACRSVSRLTPVMRSVAGAGEGSREEGGSWRGAEERRRHRAVARSPCPGGDPACCLAARRGPLHLRGPAWEALPRTGGPRDTIMTTLLRSVGL